MMALSAIELTLLILGHAALIREAVMVLPFHFSIMGLYHFKIDLATLPFIKT